MARQIKRYESTIQGNYVFINEYLVDLETLESTLIDFVEIQMSNSRIVPITKESGTILEKTGLSIISNNVNVFVFQKFSEVILEGIINLVENQFLCQNIVQSFDENLAYFAKNTGNSGKINLQWGGITGDIAEQSDLQIAFNNKADVPLKLRVSGINDYIPESDVNEARLLFDFSHLNFENGNKYVLLIDRYKPREWKKSKNVINIDDDGNPFIDTIKVWYPAKFYHESFNDALANNRKSEIPIERNALIHVPIEANKYFGGINDGLGGKRWFPKPKGYRKNTNRSQYQGLVVLQFRIRILNEFNELIHETNSLAKIQIVSSLDNRKITYKLI